MSVKLDLLVEQLTKAGFTFSGVSYVAEQHETALPATFFTYGDGYVRVDWVGDPPDQTTLDAIQAAITAHDPEGQTDAEIAEEIAVTAKTDFSSMPDWATWTATEASDWIETNVTDLASAKLVLQKMAMAIIYLRDVLKINL